MAASQDIEAWISAAIDAGHAPATLLREMRQVGWSEEQALKAIESTLAARLRALDLPVSRELIDQLPCFPYLKTHFLQRDECQQLVNFADSPLADFGQRAVSDPYWKGRILLPTNISDPHVVAMLREIRDRIVSETEHVLQRYFTLCPALFTDVINFAQWPEGFALEPHADRENSDGSAHPYAWREFGAVVYLNADFDGGEIFFPQLEMTIAPEAGSLLIFPGGLRYLHGISQVTRGIRHTLATFLTFDKSKEYIF